MKKLIVILFCLISTIVLSQSQCYSIQYYDHTQDTVYVSGCIDNTYLDELPVIMVVEENLDKMYFSIIKIIEENDYIVFICEGATEVVQFIYDELTERYFVLYDYNKETGLYETVLLYL